MLGIALIAALSLPPDALVPLPAQCPQVQAAWAPLAAVGDKAEPTEADVRLEQAAGEALRACRARIRTDEYALALILLDDVDASLHERIAAAQAAARPDNPNTLAQIHAQYWGLYNQVIDDAQAYAKQTRIAPARRCADAFVKWIDRERNALEHGADATQPLLTSRAIPAADTAADAIRLDCVRTVSGWKSQIPQKA